VAVVAAVAVVAVVAVVAGGAVVAVGGAGGGGGGRRHGEPRHLVITPMEADAAMRLAAGRCPYLPPTTCHLLLGTCLSYHQLPGCAPWPATYYGSLLTMAPRTIAPY